METPTIIVTGNKGGTGKTLIASNLALSLSGDKLRVGILDADIDSPNLPEVLGVKDLIECDSLQNFIPATVNDHLHMFSIALFSAEEGLGHSKTGDQNEQVIHDAIKYTNWGYMDYFVVDLPAGSSDEFRAVIKRLKNIIGLVVVTLPSTTSDFKRVLDLASRFRLPIIGAVENFVHLICPSCEEKIPLYGQNSTSRVEQLCEERKIPYLGGVPYMPQIHNAGHGPVIPGESFEVINNIVEALNDK